MTMSTTAYNANAVFVTPCCQPQGSTSNKGVKEGLRTSTHC